MATIIPLTISPTGVTAVTRSGAGALTNTSGTPTYTSVSTPLGSATGFSQLYAAGGASAPAWASLFALGDPDGHGWLWDSVSLEQQMLQGGVWSGSFELTVSAGSVTADIYARWSLYNSTSGTFETIGTLVTAGQTLAQSSGYVSVNISGALPPMRFGTGDKLYLDVWANVTSNSTGSTTATISLGGISSTLVMGNAFTTPGFTALTPTQRATAYFYGDFCFNDGVNYLLIDKPLDTVPVKETLFKVARFEGMKKTGEVVNERTISLKIRVIGASRADLETKLDALAQAFSYRQQNLSIHSVDQRYFVADCIGMSVSLPPGMLISAIVQAQFLCQQPYAYAASQSSYSTGNLALQNNGAGIWTPGNQTLIGGGNIASRPTITLQNETAVNNLTLTAALASGTAYTTLSVSALTNAVVSGDTFVLSDGAGHTQTVTASGAASAGATSLPVSSFTANFSYPATTTTVTKTVTITQVSVNQFSDAQVLTVNNLTMGTGDTLTIDCDPTTQAGYTVAVNGGAPLAFTGVFPIMEPGPTSWEVNVYCASPATVTLTWTWTPRWLS